MGRVQNIKSPSAISSSIMSKLRSRQSDTRSVLTKAICSSVQPHIVQTIADTHLARAIELRGNIEAKRWRTNGVPCLYCGRPAVEIDHYQSAVRNGAGRFIFETPVNRVPSCAGCHRAAKDKYEDVIEWHSIPQHMRSPLHPRNVVSERQWKRAHSRLIKWDAFHKRVIHLYESKHSRLLAEVVETIIQRMYADEGGAAKRLIESAIVFTQQ